MENGKLQKKKKDDRDLIQWAKELLSQFTRGFKHYPEPDEEEEMDIADQAALGHYPGSNNIYTIGRDDQEEEEKEDDKNN